MNKTAAATQITAPITTIFGQVGDQMFEKFKPSSDKAGTTKMTTCLQQQQQQRRQRRGQQQLQHQQRHQSEKRYNGRLKG
jgi:hypothetical protein